MSDRQEEAIVSLVNRAKRLQMNSVLTKEATAERLPQDPEYGQYILLDMPEVKPNPEDTRPVLSAGANRKVRRIDGDGTQPPPPPPSPRGCDRLAELWDDYMETAHLVDKICLEAKILKSDMLYYAQHQRDIALVQEIELEMIQRSLDAMESLVGGVGMELESKEFEDTMKRCRNTIERIERRDAI